MKDALTQLSFFQKATRPGTTISHPALGIRYVSSVPWRVSLFHPHLEDHPRTCKWLIWWLLERPLRIGLFSSPSIHGLILAFLHGSDPKHWMILQAASLLQPLGPPPAQPPNMPRPTPRAPPKPRAPRPPRPNCQLPKPPEFFWESDGWQKKHPDL